MVWIEQDNMRVYAECNWAIPVCGRGIAGCYRGRPSVYGGRVCNGGLVVCTKQLSQDSTGEARKDGIRG